MLLTYQWANDLDAAFGTMEVKQAGKVGSAQKKPAKESVLRASAAAPPAVPLHSPPPAPTAQSDPFADDFAIFETKPSAQTPAVASLPNPAPATASPVPVLVSSTTTPVQNPATPFDDMFADPSPNSAEQKPASTAGMSETDFDAFFESLNKK